MLILLLKMKINEIENKIMFMINICKYENIKIKIIFN